MDRKTQNRLEARAKIVKALAHPSRLFIVEELSKGERCVCELQALIGADMSTVSKHLSVLKNAGIIRDKRCSNKIIYSLRCPCILKFMACIEETLSANVEEQMAEVLGKR